MSVQDLYWEPENTPIHDALVEGTAVLSQDEEICFFPYVKMILPIDGFIVWLNAALLQPAQLAQYQLQSPGSITIPGSLHYASIGVQREDETFVIRQMDFTAGQPIAAFEEIGLDVLYVGEVNTPLGPFQFTFSRRNSFYKAAKIYHYVGDAVYPVFKQLLIDRQQDFDQRQVISNSLPIWLSMLTGTAPFPSMFITNAPVYPAMLVKENLPPPYIAVEVEETPRLIQTIPLLSRNSSVSQLAVDRVHLITYGLRNDQVMDLRDYILEYSLNTGSIGITAVPVISDVRRPQIELGALAFKKRIDLEVSYYQGSAREIARQLINVATFGVTVNDANIIPPPINQ